jgi:methylenetetrahydrofolate dehydrogenase (NADP+)/methenyltetrahydrofolate cyclohydrolase
MTNAVIFNGKTWAESEEEILKHQISELKESFGVSPKLVSILVGDDPASRLYTSLKKKAAERVGAKFEIRYFENLADQDTLISLIEKLNEDPKVHGIMIQLPLPEDLKEVTSEIISSISPEKDVDGLRSDSPFLHSTAVAILEIIENVLTNFDKTKTQIVVVGARGMVGRPLIKRLEEDGYKVIKCHSQTKDLKKETLKADILISATGAPNLIKGSMVKRGVFVIDVGSPKADIEFASVSKKARFITPVPGGIGPMTIACLLENLYQAAFLQTNE